jgi:beta-xylosidase
MMYFLKLSAVLGLAIVLVLGRLGAATPVEALDMDFPDPSIVKDPRSSDWYAFATAGNGKKLQAATAPSSTGPWTWLDVDILPALGSWAVTTGIWAPDVRYLAEEDSFLLYYSAPYAANTSFHCVGAAVASSILGPYTATSQPVACPITQGGAIDAAGYYDDATSTRWLVYKIDGNSIGHGGSCNNGVAPIVPTPIMMQQLALDGYTPMGQPFEILDRGQADGPLIEAPDLIKAADGTYVLFFSSNCYSSTLYDISYATAPALEGPYTKSSAPLLVTGDYGLTSPGGATSITGGGQLVFHVTCGQNPLKRCMYQTSVSVAANTVTIT